MSRSESDEEQGPERSCIGCGAHFAKERLLRLVAGPDGKVEVDVAGRLPGRGAYLFPNRECFMRTEVKRNLGRALKRGGLVFEPERLFETAAKCNRGKLLEDLRLALKAQAITSGGNTIESILGSGRIALFLVADDASANTRERVQGWAHRLSVPIVVALSQEEIGGVLGKESRAVVAVTAAPFAQKLIRDGSLYDAIMNRTHCHTKR